MLKTIGEAAAPLARATGADQAAIARQLRGWVQQGVLEPTKREARGTTGAIAATLLDDVGIARARLLLALAAMGAGLHLREIVRSAEDTGSSISYEPVGTNRHTIDAVVADARAQSATDWKLEVAFYRKEGGGVGVLVQWLRNGKRTLAGPKPGEYVSEGVIVLPVTELILPLLTELDR